MTDREFLRTIATQLRQWAAESKSGGWSTHQVDPMRKLADRIDEHLGSERVRIAAGKKFGDGDWESY